MDIVQVFCYGHTRPDPDWPHNRAVYINRLYHVHSGKGYCYLGGKNYELLPGKLYFIPDSKDLKLSTDKDDPILHTFIDFDIIPPVVTNKVLSADIKDDAFLRATIELFDLGGKYMQERGIYSYNHCPRQMRKLIDYAVTFIASYIVDENKLSVINDKSILKALDIIHENFNTPLTVENIAKQCFMNKDYLIRKFSKLVGLTPYAYIKRLRILNARRLRSQGLTLSEIAVKTGYSDAASVSHALKKY